MSASDKLAQSLALIVPAALLAGAYISQYVFGLFPCEMCWWQRWPHFAAIGFAALSLFTPPKRIWVAIAAGGILTSGLIGFFHAGVEYGFWEGVTGCALPAAAGVDPLEAIFDQPVVRCDQAPWSMAGISLAGFNAIISIAAAVTIWVLLARKDKA
ncbi:disulfide bond formation protein B [Alteraurantiacibacter aquimixticola]|uniref:Disulfide bond formation protein B n=1 Tax=Alteraurantiacibacter aquimixticola TaxID=2489173 RepID=A0A4T3EX67_9SPHN|nr:disulfide bond formation protein B [Alteraurantiacibacter aquimixticola]TIX49185.1 disulfide bond formation protein B [Alteraurantiacibacter aquimixticola]